MILLFLGGVNRKKKMRFWGCRPRRNNCEIFLSRWRQRLSSDGVRRSKIVSLCPPLRLTRRSRSPMATILRLSVAGPSSSSSSGRGADQGMRSEPQMESGLSQLSDASRYVAARGGAAIAAVLWAAVQRIACAHAHRDRPLPLAPSTHHSFPGFPPSLLSSPTSPPLSSIEHGHLRGVKGACLNLPTSFSLCPSFEALKGVQYVQVGGFFEGDIFSGFGSKL